MTKVDWSRAALVYDGTARLSNLLGDLRPFAGFADDEAPRAYVALRLDRHTWRVQTASALARRIPTSELRAISERTRHSARLVDVADLLVRHLAPAIVFRAGRRLALLAEVPEPRFAVVLDHDDRLLWIGERAPRPVMKGERWTDWLRAIWRSGRSASWPPPPAEPSTPIPPVARAAPPSHAREAEPPNDAMASAEPPTAAAEPNTAAAPPTAPAEAAAPAEERYLQGDLFREEDANWVAAEPQLVRKETYRLDVFIGPPGLGTIQASAAFRDDLLDWDRQDVFHLQVVFNEIGVIGRAQSGWIDLRRRGASSVCSFMFVPQATAHFRGRISVLHEGRVLQTAVVQAAVVDSVGAARAGAAGGLHPQVEMIVRHDLASLEERRPFDVSLILNHAVDGSAAMTAASRDGAYVSSLDDLQAQLAAISDLLVELANNSKVHTKGLATTANAAWLGRLAAEGNFLFRKLVLDYIGQSPTADALRKASTMQIVSARPDAVVPLEFVYEYPPPATDAPVCPNAAQALEQGHCPETCQPKKSPANCVCPMGFWGLGRVIERHVHDPRLGVAAAISASEPTASRKKLDTSGAALLAISEQVPKEDQQALSDQVKKVWKGAVAVAANWESWPEEVEARKPSLFIVLPHTSGKGADLALEIQGHTQECRFIDRSYVCPDGLPAPPIVLLLGCDTASVADKDAYTSNIAVFRQAGSAIVIATTAALIWGADAAKVASEIMDALGKALPNAPDSFGDVLLAAKRRSVHDSQLMAMSLAAFGDADWRFKD